MNSFKIMNKREVMTNYNLNKYWKIIWNKMKLMDYKHHTIIKKC
jgi:hypothetical protein